MVLTSSYAQKNRSTSFEHTSAATVSHNCQDQRMNIMHEVQTLCIESSNMVAQTIQSVLRQGEAVMRKMSSQILTLSRPPGNARR